MSRYAGQPLLALAALLLLTLAGVAPVWANEASSVSLEQEVRCPETGGFLLGLQPGGQPGTDESGTRRLRLTAGFDGCVPRSWQVTMLASTPAAPDAGAAAHVRLSRLGAVNRLDGPAADLPGGGSLTAPLPLDSSRQILTASASTSLGTYDSLLGLDLAAPATAHRAATLTLTIAVAP